MSRLVLAVVVAGSALFGCRGDPADDLPGHEVRISVAPTPPAVGPVRVVVEVRDEEGRGVEGARVRLTGDMAHAGMAPVEAELREEEDGRYSVSDFELTMGGDWILTARIELPDGRTLERRREARVVSAGPASRSPGGA